MIFSFQLLTTSGLTRELSQSHIRLYQTTVWAYKKRLYTQIVDDEF